MARCQYRAADVAACIIDYACSLGKPVSNLQLQKLLFFSQCTYLQRTQGDLLFDDPIVAWQYGPVVKSVYRAYSFYGASSIRKPVRPLGGSYADAFADLTGTARDVVMDVVRKWIGKPAWDLVRETHKEGGAWHYVYFDEGGLNREGAGYDQVIERGLMLREVLV